MVEIWGQYIIYFGQCCSPTMAWMARLVVPDWAALLESGIELAVVRGTEIHARKGRLLGTAD